MARKVRPKAKERKQFDTENRRGKVFEQLERRQYLAAFIQGSPTSYATIQAAIDAAVAGQTINVEAGNYPEAVYVGKTLTVRGVKAGIDARSNARDGSGESNVTGVDVGGGLFSYGFRVAANNVILDGFTVQGQSNNSTTAGAAIVINPTVNGTQILNNIVQNNATGLYLANNSASNPAIIRKNIFRNNNNTTGANPGRGIYSDGGVSGGLLQNVQIDQNFFYRNLGGATWGVEAAIGLESYTVSSQTNISITNNVFDTNGKALLAFDTNNLTITGNVVGNHYDVSSAAFRFEGGNTNVTIQNNNFYGSGGRAIFIDEKAVARSNNNFNITSNNIYQNGLEPEGERTGLMTDAGQYDGTLTATNNWWGAASGPDGDGPGTGDTVISNGVNIVYTPFATSPVIERQVPFYGTGYGFTTNANIQTEDFDHGLQGISYNDTSSGNSGGAYRPNQDVDIVTNTDTGGGYMVGTTRAGEWLEYTINVPAGGTYRFDGRVMSTSSGAVVNLSIDGVAVSGSLTIPSSGSWQTVQKTGINITAGTHLLRLTFTTQNSGGNVGSWNWIKLVPTAVSQPPTAPNGLAASATSATQINLTWLDNATDETAYIVERKTGVGGTWGILTSTLPVNSVSYSDTTAAATTTYYYRVRATNGAGDSGNSNEAFATTPAPTGTTYLSDMNWVGTPTNGWGPVEKDMANGGQLAGDGNVITLNTVTYAKGLGAHAASEIIYQLNGGYTSFLADIGVDDGTGAGTVIFQVIGDGVTLYTSPLRAQADAALPINVNITGVQQLRLVVTDGGDGNSYDHADWANARVVAITGPTAPTNLVAIAGGTTQINLTWTDNATTETGYLIERSPDGSTGWTQIGTAGANATGYNDSTGLSPGTTYYYRVRATDGTNNSGYSNTANATTQTVPTAPAAPTSLAATAFSHTQINLTWTDNANNETGFIVERSPDGSTGWTQIGTPGVNAISFSDTTALPSTQYFYRVRATNGVGPSTDSNVANATTPAAPTVPAAPTNLNASAVSVSQINLTWTDNASNETGFIVERSPNGTTGWTQIATPAVNAVSHNDSTGLSAGTTYYYRVRAINGVGPSTDSNIAGATTFTTGSVTYISTGATGWKYLDNGTNQGTAWRATAFVDTSWSTGTAELGYGDGDEATTVSYGPSSSNKYVTTYFRKSFNVAAASQVSALQLRIKRDDGVVVYLNGTEVYRNNLTTGTVAYNTYATDAIEDNTYLVVNLNTYLGSLLTGTNVLAVEVHQSDPTSSDLSMDAELTATITQPASPPAAPSALGATANGQTQINLNWTDNANNETGFIVERSPDGTNNWTQVGTPAANATTYADNTVSAGTTYYYRVRATNGQQSGNSNVANATTASATPPSAASGLVAAAASASQINLTWTDNSNNETGFKIERSLDGVSGWTLITTTSSNAISYNDTAGPSASTQYFYRVRATNTAGDAVDSNVATAITPSAPSLPSPWISGDIGSVSAAGNGTYSGETFTVKGAGSDIWKNSDSFQYVYQPWTGNGQIIVRVTGMQNTHAWAKAGVMFRETLAANSKQASVVMTPNNGIVFIRRASAGGSSTGTFVSGASSPYYLKLIRNGSTFSAYRSTNGTTWTSVGSATISMSSTIYVGLAVASKSTMLNTATFTNVTLSTSTSSTLGAGSGSFLMLQQSPPSLLVASSPASAGEIVDLAAT